MAGQSDDDDVTGLLVQFRAGNRDAEDILFRIVYAELRRLASHYLHEERPDHTLQPTALVHEAYIRLIGLHDIDWQDRSHFFAIAATTMRRILVDHARAQRACKREALHNAVSLEDALVVSPERAAEVIAVDEALDKFAQVDPRRAKVVEMLFFGGLSEEEITAVLDISVRTVKRDFKIAKDWLYAELERNRA